MSLNSLWGGLIALLLLPALASAAPETIDGVLRRVAITDREIVVVGPGAKGAETETTIAVPETASVLRDGKSIGFEELKEGDKVTVKAEKRDGHWSATGVQLGMAVPETKRPKLLPRLRFALRLADAILQSMEEERK